MRSRNEYYTRRWQIVLAGGKRLVQKSRDPEVRRSRGPEFFRSLTPAGPKSAMILSAFLLLNFLIKCSVVSDDISNYW